MKQGFLALLAIVVSLPLVGAAQPKAAAADPRVEISKRFPGSRPEDFRASPLPGIFE